MNLFSLIDIDIAAIIILSIVLTFSYKKLHITCNEDHFKLFNTLTISTIIILFLELISMVLPHWQYPALIPISYAVNTLGFIICPIIPLIFTIQLRSWLKIPSHMNLFYIPVMINFIICILNLRYPIIFSITSTNQYVRESLFCLQFIAAYSYILYNFITLLKHKKDMTHREFIVFLNFVIIPATAALIQILSPTTLIIWSGSAIAITLFYIFLQEITLTQDPLTHAQNRLGFETRVSTLTSCKCSIFSMILLDLDEFKEINDTYGHVEGDTALITMVSLLKNTFKEGGEVFRVGGDEFIVIMPTSDRIVIEQSLSLLSREVTSYNDSRQKPYALKFSAGYEIYSPSFEHFHDYMITLDRLMYCNKNKRKPM